MKELVIFSFLSVWFSHVRVLPLFLLGIREIYICLLNTWQAKDHSNDVFRDNRRSPLLQLDTLLNSVVLADISVICFRVCKVKNRWPTFWVYNRWQWRVILCSSVVFFLQIRCSRDIINWRRYEWPLSHRQLICQRAVFGMGLNMEKMHFFVNNILRFIDQYKISNKQGTVHGF